METRNTRSYRAFVQQLLHTDEHQDQDDDIYDGVCFLNPHSGAVEYAQGSFAMSTNASSSYQLSVDIHDGNSGGGSLLDTHQFLRAFEQITKRALQQEMRLQHHEQHQQADDECELTPAFHVGDAAFQLVSASFTTVCAVASGRNHALVVERLPFGVLVVLVRHPQTLESVIPRISRACAPLRR